MLLTPHEQPIEEAAGAPGNEATRALDKYSRG
jgi:hypothetical protein